MEAEAPLDLEVLRNGQPVKIQLTPTWGDPGDGDAALGDRHLLPLRDFAAPLFAADGNRQGRRASTSILADKMLYLVGATLHRQRLHQADAGAAGHRAGVEPGGEAGLWRLD